MTIEKIALDSNLSLLLIVGRAERGLIARHKRLKGYSEDDYELLIAHLRSANALVTTPNTLTEISNIASFGLTDASLDRVIRSYQAFVLDCTEVHHPSRQLVERTEFSWLGLADCAWLAVLCHGTSLLTSDNELHIAAMLCGHASINFNHSKAALGLR